MKAKHFVKFIFFLFGSKFSQEMDPFEVLPPELHVQILQYFNNEMIRDCSLVSKNWYKVIGSSPDCMKRLKIEFNYYFVDYIDSLLESTRLYRHLTIGILDPEFFEEFHKSPFKFLFMNVAKLQQILQKFSHSLTSIDTIVDCPNSEHKALKYLKFDDYGYFDFKHMELCGTGLLPSSVSTIEHLTINRKINSDSLEILKNALKEMNQLKSLEVTADILDDETIQQFKFPLLNHLRLAENRTGLQLQHFTFILNALPCLKYFEFVPSLLDEVEEIKPGPMPKNDNLELMLTINDFLLANMFSLYALKKVTLGWFTKDIFEMIFQHPSINHVIFLYIPPESLYHGDWPSYLDLIKQQTRITFEYRGYIVGVDSDCHFLAAFFKSDIKQLLDYCDCDECDTYINQLIII